MPLTLDDLEARGLTALVADLDGVITQTAHVHARAWKALFDDFLARWAARHGQPQAPFDADADYHGHVDGKPRFDGVRDFLAHRGIHLPEGQDDDPPEAETIRALGHAKNRHFNAIVRRDGVTPFAGAVRVLEAWRDRGLATALVSSSRNARPILEGAGILGLFDTILDGNDAADAGLPGKPAPDTFVIATQRLGHTPAQAAMVEDALVGVEAGRAGGFGLVIGIDRGTGAEALLEHGADVVLTDLGDLLHP